VSIVWTEISSFQVNIKLKAMPGAADNNFHLTLLNRT